MTPQTHLLLVYGTCQIALFAVAVHDVNRVTVVYPMLLVRHDERVPQARHLR